MHNITRITTVIGEVCDFEIIVQNYLKLINGLLRQLILNTANRLLGLINRTSSFKSKAVVLC